MLGQKWPPLAVGLGGMNEVCKSCSIEDGSCTVVEVAMWATRSVVRLVTTVVVTRVAWLLALLVATVATFGVLSDVVMNALLLFHECNK